MMKSRVPTSLVLKDLLDGAPADHVTVAWLLESLRERSFGMVMLIMSIIGIVPGASLFVGVLMAIPTVQMMLGHESPVFPRMVIQPPTSHTKGRAPRP